jgi:hypothetical protein
MEFKYQASMWDVDLRRLFKSSEEITEGEVKR